MSEGDRTVWSELTDDRVRANESAGGDQHSIVAPTRHELGKILEARSEALDDVEKLERLEVRGGGLAVRATFAAQLPIESSKNDGAARTS